MNAVQDSAAQIVYWHRGLPRSARNWWRSTPWRLTSLLGQVLAILRNVEVRVGSRLLFRQPSTTVQ